MGAFVLVVAPGRSPDADLAGLLVADRLIGAGHRLLGREQSPPDEPTIRARVREIAARPEVEILVVVGGSACSPADRAPEAVRPLMAPELPGFGELFRAVSFAESGPSALRSRATAGYVGSTFVALLPANAAGCSLALDRLILPELRALGAERRAPFPNAPDPRPALPGRERVRVEPLPPPEPPPPAPPQPALPPPEAPGPIESTGWRAALAALVGELRRGTEPPVRDLMRANAALSDVLGSAGERAAFVFQDGTVMGVFGFPDLVRPASKVLLFGAGAPHGVIVALHRYPRPAGLVARPALLGLPEPDVDVKAWARAQTGFACPATGTAFAMEGALVWVLQKGQVVAWDGRRLRPEGATAAAIGSLALRWSAR